ncbi:hypothetical protein C8R45DRAFT_1011677 [Mycena sanguinolenta]|nr:hypothetical protein C8R45DRAFT_1011677 [Mycena sanguinolenta]
MPPRPSTLPPLPSDIRGDRKCRYKPQRIMQLDGCCAQKIGTVRACLPCLFLCVSLRHFSRFFRRILLLFTNRGPDTRSARICRASDTSTPYTQSSSSSPPSRFPPCSVVSAPRVLHVQRSLPPPPSDCAPLSHRPKMYALRTFQSARRVVSCRVLSGVAADLCLRCHYEERTIKVNCTARCSRRHRAHHITNTTTAGMCAACTPCLLPVASPLPCPSFGCVPWLPSVSSRRLVHQCYRLPVRVSISSHQLRSLGVRIREYQHCCLASSALSGRFFFDILYIFWVHAIVTRSFIDVVLSLMYQSQSPAATSLRTVPLSLPLYTPNLGSLWQVFILQNSCIHGGPDMTYFLRLTTPRRRC